MDIPLTAPFPHKLWRLWSRSLRHKLTPAEQKDLDRLLGKDGPGRTIAVSELRVADRGERV
jgi:hypothetical protein